MKIGVICEFYPASYRPGLDTEFAQFLRDGHDVTIYSGSSMGSADDETIAGFRLEERTRNFPAFARDIARFVGPVAVGTMTRPGFALRAARLAAGVEASPKERVTEWVRMFSLPADPPDIWLFHALAAGRAFPWLGKLYSDRPIALYFHGSEVPKYTRKRPPSIDRAVWDQCTIVFTNTPFFVDEVARQGCPIEKIEVVPGGFDLARFPNDAARVYRPDGLLRLISAGRLSDEKGMAFSLEAVRGLIKGGMTNIRYTIVGEGHLRPTLEQFVRDNRLNDFVTFTGTLSSSKLFERLRASDALVLPSIRFAGFIENQARIVQEALLCQTAVVTSDDGGIPQSIPEVMRPLAVPPESSEALAGAITKLSRLSADQLSAIAAVGRAWVVENYNIKNINHELLSRTMRSAKKLGLRSIEV